MSWRGADQTQRGDARREEGITASQAISVDGMLYKNTMKGEQWHLDCLAGRCVRTASQRWAELWRVGALGIVTGHAASEQ